MIVPLKGAGPLFQQVYEALRGEILAGRLASGARLPSSRALASDLGVSRTTVMLAYDQLLAEGYVAGRVGSGTYVASELPDAALGAPAPEPATAAPAVARLSAYGARVRALDVIPPSRPGAVRYDFRYGLPPVEEFPHETWRRILARRARAASLATLRYGPPEGYGPLREAIAAYLRRSRAVSCRPEQVVVVNGSQQALDLTARVLVDPGDAVVIEEPHYQGARKVFQAAGARLVPVAVDADGLDATSLPAEAAGARLAYVTPSHQFPTGATMTIARRLELLAWAEAADGYVLEDDYDSEFRYASRPLPSLQGIDPYGRVIHFGTFSKLLFPALRLGYLVLPEDLVDPFVGARIGDSPPKLEQMVLADFMVEGHFYRHVRRMRALYARRHEVVRREAERLLGDVMTVEAPDAGMYLLARLDASVPDVAVSRAAAARGVEAQALSPFYSEEPRGNGLLLGFASVGPREARAAMRVLQAAVINL